VLYNSGTNFGAIIVSHFVPFVGLALGWQMGNLIGLGILHVLNPRLEPEQL